MKAKLSSTASSQDHPHTDELKKMEEVDQLKYLGSTKTKEGTSEKETKFSLAQAHSAMTKLAIL